MNFKRKKTSTRRAAERTAPASADQQLLEYVERVRRECYRERELLIRDYRRLLAPQNAEEISTVDEIATAHWQLQLLGRHEDALIEEKANELARGNPKAEDFDLLFRALDILNAEGGEYAAVQSMHARCSHEFMNAYSRLELLRAKTENCRTN